MVLKIGHRGACGYEPDNTLRSFKKALDLNVDAVELDVHLSKCGELVVIHDSQLEKTTNGKGNVHEKELGELKTLDAGKGEKIPTLKEVLDLINRKVKINIELKSEGTAKPVSEVINKYVNENGWSYDDFFISSFFHHELLDIAKHSPHVEISPLIVGVPVDFAEFAEKVNASSVQIPVDFINKEFVDDVHKRGMKVIVWNANTEDEIKKAKSLKVDGISSKYPDKI